MKPMNSSRPMNRKFRLGTNSRAARTARTISPPQMFPQSRRVSVRIRKSSLANSMGPTKMSITAPTSGPSLNAGKLNDELEEILEAAGLLAQSCGRKDRKDDQDGHDDPRGEDRVRDRDVVPDRDGPERRDRVVSGERKHRSARLVGHVDIGLPGQPVGEIAGQ